MKAKAIYLIVLLTALTRSAGAQTLDLTLLDPDPRVAQGTTSVAFDAIISNPSTVTIYLNGDGFSTAGPLLLNDAPFWADAPTSLAPGASTGPIELFDVGLPGSTPAGMFSGNVFSIFGGADGGAGTAFSDLGDGRFSVDVVPAAVPEIGPGAAMTSGLALLAGFLVAFRRRGARPG